MRSKSVLLLSHYSTLHTPGPWASSGQEAIIQWHIPHISCVDRASLDFSVSQMFCVHDPDQLSLWKFFVPRIRVAVPVLCLPTQSSALKVENFFSESPALNWLNLTPVLLAKLIIPWCATAWIFFSAPKSYYLVFMQSAKLVCCPAALAYAVTPSSGIRFGSFDWLF